MEKYYPQDEGLFAVYERGMRFKGALIDGAGCIFDRGLEIVEKVFVWLHWFFSWLQVTI